MEHIDVLKKARQKYDKYRFKEAQQLVLSKEDPKLFREYSDYRYRLTLPKISSFMDLQSTPKLLTRVAEIILMEPLARADT